MRRVSPCFPQSAFRRSVQAGLGGFALVAYPAEYRNSGVITFLVNHQGSVYEKDLRPNTARIAGGMTAFNPDNTWRRVTDAAQPSTGAK
jgi:hypothetical protein